MSAYGCGAGVESTMEMAQKGVSPRVYPIVKYDIVHTSFASPDGAAAATSSCGRDIRTALHLAPVGRLQFLLELWLRFQHRVQLGVVKSHVVNKSHEGNKCVCRGLERDQKERNLADRLKL